MNGMLKKVTARVLKCCSATSGFLMSGVLLSAGAQTTLGSNVANAGSKLLNEFKSIYCGSIGWLLMGICAATIFFSKNDKLVGWAKKGLIGCIVLYIILKILVQANGGVIGTTINEVGTWISG